MTSATMEQAPTAVFVCRGKKHGASNDAWRKGCRHPHAIKAHEEWLATHRKSRAARVDEAGNCTAAKHNSNQAYMQAGCRCPKAVSLFRAASKRREDAAMIAKTREYAQKYAAQAALTRRLTGGRIEMDPRRGWRHGRMAVDRNNLFWLMQGYPDSPTRGELMAAAIRMEDPSARPRTRDAWFLPSRPMYNAELAVRLGCSLTTLKQLWEDRSALRERRAERRLADAQFRAAYRAAGADRRAAKAAR